MMGWKAQSSCTKPVENQHQQVTWRPGALGFKVCTLFTVTGQYCAVLFKLASSLCGFTYYLYFFLLDFQNAEACSIDKVYGGIF